MQIAGGRLDAATNIGAAELLDLHNEMCYCPAPPAKIMLICLKAAEGVCVCVCVGEQGSGCFLKLCASRSKMLIMPGTAEFQ